MGRGIKGIEQLFRGRDPEFRWHRSRVLGCSRHHLPALSFRVQLRTDGMQVSADHLLAQARERFAVQDYYGAVHLLEELAGLGPELCRRPPPARPFAGAPGSQGAGSGRVRAGPGAQPPLHRSQYPPRHLLSELGRARRPRKRSVPRRPRRRRPRGYPAGGGPARQSARRAGRGVRRGGCAERSDRGAAPGSGPGTGLPRPALPARPPPAGGQPAAGGARGAGEDSGRAPRLRRCPGLARPGPLPRRRRVGGGGHLAPLPATRRPKTRGWRRISPWRAGCRM